MTELISEFTNISIFAAINLPIPKTKPVDLFQTIYVFGIKHKPFTFSDYVNVMRSPFEGLVMRSGGFRPGELNVFMSGNRKGMSMSQLKILKGRGE